MDYNEAVQHGNDLVLTGVRHFDPDQTLDCGQSFRWASESNTYTGIALGRTLSIMLTGDTMTFLNLSKDDFDSRWKSYFDLDRDYGKLHERLACDSTMEKALAFSPGLRILRQEPWEALCTFILSQNSNIPRIKRMVTMLCECFGDKLPEGGHTFPSPERIAVLTAADITPVRCGYRDEYILDAARRVSSGQLELEALFTLPVDEAREALLKVHGVGPKVAECALLYGFGRTECFPLDVWMKRVMKAFYPLGFPAELSDIAGLAQQFLFHYARMGYLPDESLEA